MDELMEKLDKTIKNMTYGELKGAFKIIKILEKIDYGELNEPMIIFLTNLGKTIKYKIENICR